MYPQNAGCWLYRWANIFVSLQPKQWDKYLNLFQLKNRWEISHWFHSMLFIIENGFSSPYCYFMIIYSSFVSSFFWWFFLFLSRWFSLFLLLLMLFFVVRRSVCNECAGRGDRGEHQTMLPFPKRIARYWVEHDFDLTHIQLQSCEIFIAVPDIYDCDYICGSQNETRLFEDLF